MATLISQRRVVARGSQLSPACFTASGIDGSRGGPTATIDDAARRAWALWQLEDYTPRAVSELLLPSQLAASMSDLRNLVADLIQLNVPQAPAALLGVHPTDAPDEESPHELLRRLAEDIDSFDD